MVAFATPADLQDRIGPLTPEQLARADALLSDASALVDTWTGQTFVPVLGEQVALRPIRGYLWLPRRPVRAVDQVAIVDGATIGGWCWDGESRIRLPSACSTFDPLFLDPRCTRYQVTYDYGWDEPPDAIVAVVCAMVGRVLTSPSASEGMVSERIGQYNYQLQQGVGSQGVGVRLSPGDKYVLARYRQSLSTVAMR